MEIERRDWAMMLSEWAHALAKIELDELTDEELLKLHDSLNGFKAQVDELVQEVAWRRAERWWQMIPPDEARTIRLLLKGAQLTPQVLQGVPELFRLMLLVVIEDPNVVRMWAQMDPEVRAERIEDLRAALKLTERRRTTTRWEDEKESAVLAYEVLGLSSSATWVDVRKAYRDLAAKYHPDQGGDEKLFKAIQKAYKLLEGRFI
jgi:hypothetical protein